MVATFQLDGQEFIALNDEPQPKRHPKPIVRGSMDPHQDRGLAEDGARFGPASAGCPYVIPRAGGDYSRWNKTAGIGVRQESMEHRFVRSRPF
jgi:hypothetical protein